MEQFRPFLFFTPDIFLLQNLARLDLFCFSKVFRMGRVRLFGILLDERAGQKCSSPKGRVRQFSLQVSATRGWTSPDDRGGPDRSGWGAACTFRRGFRSFKPSLFLNKHHSAFLGQTFFLSFFFPNTQEVQHLQFHHKHHAIIIFLLAHIFARKCRSSFACGFWSAWNSSAASWRCNNHDGQHYSHRVGRR